MLPFWFSGTIVWHAGTSPFISQTTLTVMIVSLGIVIFVFNPRAHPEDLWALLRSIRDDQERETVS